MGLSFFLLWHLYTLNCTYTIVHEYLKVMPKIKNRISNFITLCYSCSAPSVYEIDNETRISDTPLTRLRCPKLGHCKRTSKRKTLATVSQYCILPLLDCSFEIYYFLNHSANFRIAIALCEKPFFSSIVISAKDFPLPFGWKIGSKPKGVLP